MNNERNLNDTKDDPKDNLRISIISALVALSIAALAIRLAPDGIIEIVNKDLLCQDRVTNRIY